MKTIKMVGLVFLVSVLTQCQKSVEQKYPQVNAPVAEIKPHEITSKHGDKRVDNYFWLRHREDTAVVNYLKAENKYLDTMMAHTKAFQEKLFLEMKGRIKEKDESVPYKIDDFYYYTRVEEGGEYPVYCRKKGSLEGSEEIIANGNEMGKGRGYFSMFASASPNHNIATLAVDTVGRRFYTLSFKDMLTGKMLADRIPGTTGNFEWANNNKTVFYSKQDPNTLRADKIYRHELGTETSKDVLVFLEKDQTLSSYIGKSRSKKFLIIQSVRTDASVVQFMEIDNNKSKLTVFEPLKENVQYSVDHLNGKFYIRTNADATNYRLAFLDDNKMGKENWKDVVPNRTDKFLEGFELFNDFLVVQETFEGLAHIRMIKWADQAEHSIDFGEAAYVAGIGTNPDPKSTMLRYYYQSMTTPSSQYDYEMITKEKKLLKEQEVPGGFDRTNYQTERVWATARDGVKVPVSLVYRKDKFKKDGTDPCLQYAYGSYGFSMPAYFSSSRLSLLDRGFVFAIAHIRGGQEMGGQWYEDGKMLKKKNTFNDFIDVSEYLINEKYASKEKLFANGGSAGGLLMGAITNMRPDLYKGIVADVPFVDVMSTMEDETIPLTTGEWKEWGNPNVKEEYDYMLSYSPYDNVEKKAYPNLLVTTGLQDSQVQYWEPAKWVAKLRTMKTDKNLLLLKTNMEAGHGGASGRFESLKEEALMYAFVLDLVGVKE
ncbi:MAG: S9 family peptidase [Flammeovirgaceae bacterium]|jgi:oligopeptidase B|nr:S9 family peptidase [Flammeovirgaceae bacterium]